MVNCKKQGFTLIELLMVLGIASILIAISAGVFVSLQRRSDLDVETRKLKSVLELARNRTLASSQSQNFGVHFDTTSNEYILFPGATFVSSDPDNETFPLPSQVIINPVALEGGGNDVVFDRLVGTTAQYGYITLQDLKDASDNTTVCIDRSGNVYVESSCESVALEFSGGTIDADLAAFPGNAGNGDPAQSFTTAVQAIYVQEAELYLRRTTPSPSNVFLEIRKNSTVENVLGRSWTVEGSSLSPTFSWVRFTFPSPVFLATSTQYFLRLRSLTDSTIAFSGATGTIYWAYEHAAASPPAYDGGDAWRYVGRLDAPAYKGEQLGPGDQYDFSFRLIYGISEPPNTDSRHLEFDLEDTADRGWSIQGATTLTLVFQDPPNPDVTENVTMANFFNSASSEFDWSGDVDVNGDTETLRVHSHFIDTYDTTLSIHRDGRLNQKAVDISVDGNAIVSYDSSGTPTVGAYGGAMIYR